MLLGFGDPKPSRPPLVLKAIAPPRSKLPTWCQEAFPGATKLNTVQSKVRASLRCFFLGFSLFSALNPTPQISNPRPVKCELGYLFVYSSVRSAQPQNPTPPERDSLEYPPLKRIPGAQNPQRHLECLEPSVVTPGPTP